MIAMFQVCSAESIEAFATIQEQRGAQTAHHVWKDSLHCQHYRSHSDEYEQHCIDFVLRRSDGDSPTKASVSMSALELCSEPQSALPVASS
ncbi:unnamed protein product [Heligmosomoides polygyrus]|uniref:Uncharacterized protein n=1 Tax=Heligmosomoides polygyrus TaxID=6339 RepID=A0A3P7X9C6_HELPZ|nr:unnamed protein product [Heligmosomoides polygyrus]